MYKVLTNYLNYMRIEKCASPITTYSYRLELEKFISFLKSDNVSNFSFCTTSMIRKYIYRAKENRGLSNSSIAKLIATIRSFFNFIFEEDIIIKNPVRKIHLPKKTHPFPKVISKHEVNMIFSAMKFSPVRCQKNYLRDKLILNTLYYTGVRRSELLSLNWDDVNLGKSILTIRSGKGGKDRTIPIHSKLAKSLDLYLTQRLPMDNYALFIGEQGKRLSKASFLNLLKMYLKLAGLESKGYITHSFRHCFATRLVESGVNIFVVQKLLGHSDISTTKIYVSISTQNLISAIENL